jgi:hypothetical protein
MRSREISLGEVLLLAGMFAAIAGVVVTAVGFLVGVSWLWYKVSLAYMELSGAWNSGGGLVLAVLFPPLLIWAALTSRYQPNWKVLSALASFLLPIMLYQTVGSRSSALGRFMMESRFLLVLLGLFWIKVFTWRVKPPALIRGGEL